MAVGKGLRAEGLLVAPARDHQPLLPVVGGLEELEPLEAVASWTTPARAANW
jgi:hypothetical protein